MKSSGFRRFAIFALALFSSALVFAASPSTYTENAKKQTGTMKVAQFNYEGKGTFSAQMAPVTGAGFQLQVGTVVTVAKTKAVKSTYAVPANYDVRIKTLFVPALIVKNATGWTYFDVTLTANTADVDAMGFPLELVVSQMVATQVGEPAAVGPVGPQGPAGPTGATGPAGPAGAGTLVCAETANGAVNNIPVNGTANAVAPFCSTLGAGYVQTSTNCESSSWLMPIVYIKLGTCSARNNDASPQDLRASRTCCRVQ